MKRTIGLLIAILILTGVANQFLFAKDSNKCSQAPDFIVIKGYYAGCTGNVQGAGPNMDAVYLNCPQAAPGDLIVIPKKYLKF